MGGQAVAFWHWYYSIRFPELVGSERLLTSKDVDYVGTIDAARSFAAGFGGSRIFEATLDDATPNCAVVVVPLGDVDLNIDFLTGILGVRYIESCLLEIDLGTKVLGISLLHPVQCLITRVVNICSPAIARRDEFAFRQLKVMFDLMTCHFLATLEDGDTEDLNFCVRELGSFLRSHEHGRRAHETIEPDLLQLLKMLLPDGRVDPRYRELTIRPIISRIERSRASRALRRSAMRT